MLRLVLGILHSVAKSPFLQGRGKLQGQTVNTSDPLKDLVETNTRLREAVTALSECLRKVLNNPSDRLALAQARYVLAKVDQIR
jgi:hypothetical protein